MCSHNDTRPRVERVFPYDFLEVRSERLAAMHDVPAFAIATTRGILLLMNYLREVLYQSNQEPAVHLTNIRSTG
jgi:hypothetical protein